MAREGFVVRHRPKVRSFMQQHMEKVFVNGGCRIATAGARGARERPQIDVDAAARVEAEVARANDVEDGQRRTAQSRLDAALRGRKGDR